LASTIVRPEDERSFHHQLARLFRISGRLAEALKEANEACRNLEEADDSPRTLEVLVERGLILLDMNRQEDFNRQIEDLKRRSELSPNAKLARFSDYLLARRENKRGDVRQAYIYAWKALDSAPRERLGTADEDLFKYFDLMAEIDERDRDRGLALNRFRLAELLTLGRAHSGEAFARSFYRAGRIHEQFVNVGFGSRITERDREHVQAAIENYRTFLDLWRDADSIFPEVDEAKIRLRALETARSSR
jgi:tetratricopeptide (TPR) repeat protein